MLVSGFSNKGQRLVLFIVIVVEIPELLFGFPPLHHTTETGDCQEDLDIPIPPMPVRMFIPSLTDVLDPLDERFTHFGLGGKLCDRHIGDIRCNTDDIV